MTRHSRGRYPEPGFAPRTLFQNGSAAQSGVGAALSRQRSWVQIPSEPPPWISPLPGVWKYSPFPLLGLTDKRIIPDIFDHQSPIGQYPRHSVRYVHTDSFNFFLSLHWGYGPKGRRRSGRPEIWVQFPIAPLGRKSGFESHLARGSVRVARRPFTSYPWKRKPIGDGTCFENRRV
jgi:hypothetical protein